MKRKERFMAALQRRTPDRVPMFDFLFDGIPVENILEMLRVGHSYGSSLYGK